MWLLLSPKLLLKPSKINWIGAIAAPSIITVKCGGVIAYFLRMSNESAIHQSLDVNFVIYTLSVHVSGLG